MEICLKLQSILINLIFTLSNIKINLIFFFFFLNVFNVFIFSFFFKIIFFIFFYKIFFLIYTCHKYTTINISLFLFSYISSLNTFVLFITSESSRLP